ncbi:hypothetical protein JMJ77_0001156 [Colletotrichum scovillei]|uniref:Uncharacterized protein n=1 Tax=Colletotrichum scovillei TaxID=1209932 RepID=A0A9P7UEY3_9PEZI|nr:hypothetical protein JMJ77_0001156 [Colletotrichum scovillei]KAG7072381.1 hypothetical protein JMJ76_0005233 [Colletotrichum scovillei]KAG7080631.1 hypothetical protein JMJ78_0007718 [Colletotrichum scovillei]
MVEQATLIIFESKDPILGRIHSSSRDAEFPKDSNWRPA